MTEFRFTNVSAALPHLAAAVMNIDAGQAEEVGTRQGDRAMELLHPHIVLTRPWEREVVTPGRRASLPAQIAETMWVLAGRNDVEWLSHYLPRAAEFSDDGEVWRGGYGPRIRQWGGEVDQLAHVVNLLREDPLTRRAVINIYDPAVDTAPGKDIPCNNWLHFTSRGGKLHLHVATRSNDLIWGWSGINAFEWSALQEIVAGMLGLQIGELHFSITSLHVYDRHWKKAADLAHLDLHQGVTESGEPRFKMPPVARLQDPVQLLDGLIRQWFLVEEVIRSGHRQAAELVTAFPEPLMRSWLVTLLWWWQPEAAAYVYGTAEHHGHGSARARYAFQASPGTPDRPAQNQPVEVPTLEGDEFAQFVSDLHAEKSAAYGDSWCRRGEQIGIMANIARKVDRLGVAGGGDTSADTAIDLLVYLIKYARWLQQKRGIAVVGENEYVSAQLHSPRLADVAAESDVQPLIDSIKRGFDDLERQVTENVGAPYKLDTVTGLKRQASALARRLWEDERAPIVPVTAVVSEASYGNPYRYAEGSEAPSARPSVVIPATRFPVDEGTAGY